MKKTFTRAAFSIFLALSLSLQNVPAFADEDAITALPDAQESFDDAINVIENAAPIEDALIPETDEQSLTEDFDEASSWELEDPGIYEESPVPDIYGVEEGVEEIAGDDDLVGIYEEEVFEGDVIEVPADNEAPAGSELPADNEVHASLDLAEPDELLDGYFEGRPALVGQGYRAENSLSGTNLIIYRELSAQIKRVAAGEQTSTYFEVPFSALGLNQNMWTAEELGVSKLMDGNMLTQETIGAILAVAGIDLDSIANVLGTAHPYELYWFDKGVGCFISGFMYSVDGETGEPNSAGFGDSIAIPFQVAAGYAASDFEIDPATGAAVKSAMAKADEIIAAASALSDCEKLLYYKSEICDLVSYNNDVYENVDNSSVDPFQIIWVFDGDPATNVVCEGYAKAFQYLCDQTAFANDIKCITVTGVMQDGVGAGLHMWNIVSMEDGKNYLADVTNCDDGSIGEPDQLFLAGYTSGDVESGYVIKCEDGDISYAYDEYARRMYDEELVLAAKKYEKTEHVHVWSDDYTVDVPATCTTEGSESIHCTLCEAINTDSVRVLEKLDHDFGEWTVTTPATEDKEGVETRTCTREGCGAAETRPIEKLTPNPSPSQDPSSSPDPSPSPSPATSPDPLSAPDPAPSPSPATSPTVSPSPAPAPAPAQTKSSLKKSQPMTVKVKSPTVKASKLKKKKYTFTKAKAFTIKNAKGTVTFRKAGGSKKLSISKTGKITVKKGTKKGTYKIKVIVTASGNDIFEAGEKAVTVKVKVK